MNWLRRIRLLFGLLVAAVVCWGCGCNGNSSSTVDKDANMIVVISRSLDTGKFQAFEIDDPVVVGKARQAVQEDLKHPDKRSNIGLGMSVNHVLVLRDKEGNTTSFEILGDEFIVVDSKRYQAQRTIEVLKYARAGGAAVPIGPEQAKRLAPCVQGYLK